MKIALKVLAGILVAGLFMSFLLWVGGVSEDNYAERMKEHQEWCLSQGGDFTRHGTGWGPDWSCTMRSNK